MNYYNENDPKAAAWLRELIKGGHIANGIVDQRSIKDVQPNDLTDFTQCHFFAGIGGWSYALRLADWPDSRPVWTGSCPCQPFSTAGKRGGTDDSRHLWPEFYRLIAECRPATVFGEQVASKDGLNWFDLVSTDLEGAGYAVGAADLCAAGVGAPHIRQRLYFVGMADGNGSRLEISGTHEQRTDVIAAPVARGDASPVADADSQRRTRLNTLLREENNGRLASFTVSQTTGRGEYCNTVGRGESLRHASSSRSFPGAQPGIHRSEKSSRSRNGESQRPIAAWDNAEYLPCTDGKARPVEPGTFPLLNGISEQLVRLGALEMAGWKEVEMHGSTYQRDADEILRVLQNSVRSETDKRPAGGLRDIHAASLLSDFLLCVDAARYGAAIGGSLKEARAQAYRRIVRGVRDGGEFGGAPRQRGSEEQLPGEPADAMLRLSLILARYAEAHQKAARDAHAASGRVNMLRGYGNAIVPQVAATFVIAAMDSCHGN